MIIGAAPVPITALRRKLSRNSERIMKYKIIELIGAAARSAHTSGVLPSDAIFPDVEVEEPKAGDPRGFCHQFCHAFGQIVRKWPPAASHRP